MQRPKLEVADIFRRYGEAYRQQFGPWLSTAQRRVMTAIEICRTAALGGHVEKCDNEKCGHIRNSYNSCGDRHCPKCQSLARAEWIQDRQSELLNVPLCVGPRYVVFTTERSDLSPSGASKHYINFGQSNLLHSIQGGSICSISCSTAPKP
jgi:hypothetical protein